MEVSRSRRVLCTRGGDCFFSWMVNFRKRRRWGRTALRCTLLLYTIFEEMICPLHFCHTPHIRYSRTLTTSTILEITPGFNIITDNCLGKKGIPVGYHTHRLHKTSAKRMSERNE